MVVYAHSTPPPSPGDEEPRQDAPVLVVAQLRPQRLALRGRGHRRRLLVVRELALVELVVHAHRGEEQRAEELDRGLAAEGGVSGRDRVD